jgi:flavin reductase (DIM6/NTAB) family NADH-FMN oxidoreductase RutF
MTFTEREFRDALGLFPTGVAVVTTTAPDGEPIGATVSSFNSVSLSPPLVLFSVARSSRRFAVWSEAQHYAVNLLREDQSRISTNFARSDADKWQDHVPRQGRNKTVLLSDALAHFECESYARYDGGDHLILVGRVTALSVPASPFVRPLVFYRGRYRQLDPEQAIDTPPELTYLLHGW